MADETDNSPPFPFLTLLRLLPDPSPKRSSLNEMNRETGHYCRVYSTRRASKSQEEGPGSLLSLL